MRVEENPPILGLNFFGQYCGTIGRQILTESDESLRMELQQALEFDGSVTINVRDGENANNHCLRSCSPFHRVFVDINYSIVVP